MMTKPINYYISTTLMELISYPPPILLHRCNFRTQIVSELFEDVEKELVCKDIYGTRDALEVGERAVMRAHEFLQHGRIARQLHRLPQQLGVIQHVTDLGVPLKHINTLLKNMKRTINVHQDPTSARWINGSS